VAETFGRNDIEVGSQKPSASAEGAGSLPENQGSFKKSIKGIPWKLKPSDERLTTAITQQFAIPEIVARILASKNLNLDQIEDFLNPSLRNELPDPYILKDMSTAAERVAAAVMSGEKIGVFGDYDVDGATASSILKRYFNMLGTECMVYIPDRILEGYGPNIEAFMSLKERGAGVIITVDCGTVSFEPIEAATNSGLDIIVIDHHIGELQTPKALAVVNPNQIADESGLGHLAACGVSFLLAVAVNRVLRDLGWFANRTEPDLITLLDLVALGTVCDVMPLVGVNRAFVTQGLRVLSRRGNTGLAALMDICRVDEKPGVYHLGFIIGPRINAGGRVGEASMGSRILACDDPEEAWQFAERLNHYNSERRALEQLVLDEAIEQAAALPANNGIVIVVGYGWHPGVVGIVASRLKEIYERPVAVITFENGVGKASARSISGVNLGAVVGSAREAGLLLTGGGHAMAAGFTVAVEKLEELKQFINTRVSEELTQAISDRTLDFNSYIHLSAVNAALVENIEMLGPFGSSNPQPRFVLSNVRIAYADIVGESHVKCFLADADVSGSTYRKKLKAMAYRVMGTPMADALLNSYGRTLDVMGSLRLNRWQGSETPELVVEDIIFTD
jgi:single-stranded-DNA-specific exonuclease